MDEILAKFNVKYEDLTQEEKNTLLQWSQAINKGDISVGAIREYVASMRDSVEAELCKVGLDHKTDTYLKARLRNYMLFMAFLGTPDKAKQRLESAVAGVASGVIG